MASVSAASPAPRRNRVGGLSLLIAALGALGCHAVTAAGALGDAPWLTLASAAFDAALVGGLADWFAISALFRHPFGVPIPHTAIIPKRRKQMTESIVSIVEKEWLSPKVIGARLAKLEPSELVRDWLRREDHVQRIGGPVRDLLGGLARLLTEPEVVELAERTLRDQLRAVPIDGPASRWFARLLTSERSAGLFESLALSLANLASRPDAAEHVRRWLDQSARQLRRDGKVLVPFVLLNRLVQRKLVEAACDYAAGEMRRAAAEREHPLRQTVLGALRGAAERWERGDEVVLARISELRAALLEGVESGPLVRAVLTGVRRQLERDLAGPGYLSDFIDQRLRSGIIEALEDPAQCARFDRWVRATAGDLLRRHHDQIGLTVRESLEELDTATLVAQIEQRIGPDLQYIRLNGALVGGLIGLLLALLHRFVS